MESLGKGLGHWRMLEYVLQACLCSSILSGVLCLYLLTSPSLVAYWIPITNILILIAGVMFAVPLMFYTDDENAVSGPILAYYLWYDHFSVTN
jgi:hypothetical protein